MKKINKISLMLAIGSLLFFVESNVFANDNLFAEDKVDVTMDKEKMKEKYAKDEAQRARALSKRPKTVGVEILDREAEGLYALPQEALDNWSMGRMIPTPYKP